MPTTLPVRRRRYRRVALGEIAWISAALMIGTLAFWIAIGTPGFSQTQLTLSQLDTRSP